jgi:hypothetical protein
VERVTHCLPYVHGLILNDRMGPPSVFSYGHGPIQTYRQLSCFPAATSTMSDRSITSFSEYSLSITIIMENMLSHYAHSDSAPRRPYKPAPVTTGELMTALNEIEVEHQKNADFLTNPYLTVEPTEFHQQAITAQQVAHDLSIRESRGLPPARNDLAHGQEVLLYGTSRLRAAVTAWIHARQNDAYDESRSWWMSALMIETVSDLRDCHLFCH